MPAPKKSKNIEYEGCTKITDDAHHSETTTVTDTSYGVVNQKVQNIPRSPEAVINHEQQLNSALEQNQEKETHLEVTEYDSTLPLVTEKVQPQGKSAVNFVCPCFKVV